MSGEKSVPGLELRSCQQEGLPRARDFKGKPDQEKVASSDKDVERKTCQGEKDVQTNIWHQKELTRERVPRDDAANGCDKQAVRMRSYRLTLFLWASPLETSVTRKLLVNYL